MCFFAGVSNSLSLGPHQPLSGLQRAKWYFKTINVGVGESEFDTPVLEGC